MQGAAASQDYDYDNNGNLTYDLNKQITALGAIAPAINYNYLNLPVSISVLNDNGNADKGNIKFVYDALGNKLRKEVTDLTTTPNPTVTRTCYVNGLIYTYQINFGGLSQIASEEGRIRYAIQPNNTAEYKYDWFVKDHLGNTRMILTEESTPSPLRPYMATFEDKPTQKVTKDAIAMEKELFGEDILASVRSPLPIELQDKDPDNKKCALLKPGSSNNGKVPYKILKVRTGDKFTIAVQYYYRKLAAKTTSKNVKEDILRNLLNGILGAGGTTVADDKTRGVMQQNLAASPYSSNNALQNFTNTDNENDKAMANRPKAYLNYVLMDTAMQFIKGGALRVGEMDGKNPEWKNLAQNDIEATKAGYILVYISSEDAPTADLNAGNVYFDNMVIITNEGPVMEENHYYPFGLLMQPISTSGSGRLQNKYKFQGQEFNDDLGVDFYEFKFRQHDPQIGRFTQVDPLSDKFAYNSTYAFSENQVTSSIELEGLERINVNYMSNLIYDYNGYISSLPATQTAPTIEDFMATYVAPKSSISGSNIFKSDLYVDMISEKHNSSSLQIIQIVSTTPFNDKFEIDLLNKKSPGQLDGDNFFTGTYRFNLAGDKFQSFADGGINSPYVTGQGNPPAHPSNPYYLNKDEVNDNKAKYFTDAAGLHFRDIAGAVSSSSKVNFTTYLIGVNYLNTGKDRILGSFNWGFTNNGQTPTFTSLVFTPGFNMGTNDLNTIKHDYPGYSFFGQ